MAMTHTMQEMQAAIDDYRAGKIDATALVGNISQAAYLCAGTEAEFCEDCVIADVLTTESCQLHSAAAT